MFAHETCRKTRYRIVPNGSMQRNEGTGAPWKRQKLLEGVAASRDRVKEVLLRLAVAVQSRHAGTVRT